MLILSVAGSPAVTLERLISREPADFRIAQARLSIGADGKVYLVAGESQRAYILQLNRDGSGKTGVLVRATPNHIAVNAAGIIAIADGHFGRAVSLFDPQFAPIASVQEFLANDTLGWDAPARVTAGASGDFYGIDQYRDRILRISPQGAVKMAYAIPPVGETKNPLQQVRVDEARERFYVLRHGGQFSAVGFDGTVHWTISPGINAHTWKPDYGGFDLDASGNILVVDPRGESIRKLSPDGETVDTVTLDPPAAPSKDMEQLRVTGFGIAGGTGILRCNVASELFQVYDLATGKRQRVVPSAHEKLTVTYPSDRWVAGETIAFTIDLSAPGSTVRPHWRVWAAPWGTTHWRELTRTHDQLVVPSDFAGVYQIRITPSLRPQAGQLDDEYTLRGAIEVLHPESKGTVNVCAPANQFWHRQGDSIPFSLVVRSRETPASLPVRVWLEDANGTERWSTNLSLAAASRVDLKLSPALTRTLPPRDYRIAASAPGLTGVPQEIELGSGLPPSPFRITRYFDYQHHPYLAASAWDQPDLTGAYTSRMRRLGFNMLVDRLGNPPPWGVPFEGEGERPSEMRGLAERLKNDPIAVAPEKLHTALPLHQLLAAYSAHGLSQMAILMAMDAALPLGEKGHDSRAPEQIFDALRHVTGALARFPSFRGWDWSSGWWIYHRTGSKAAATDEERLAYGAAVARAKEKGEWDDVIERVALRRWRYAVDAQDQFNQTLVTITTNLVTATTGPYRNVEHYPPVTFANVDQVDIHYQAEQIPPPGHAPHSVDYERRPGKPAWGHPEIWNDAGTGEQIGPTLFQMMMRGVNGIGTSGDVPNWGSQPADARSSYPGLPSVFRAVNAVAQAYGSWWASLEPNDPVAIIPSRRMLAMDEWSSIGGTHHSRLFEAYQTCLAAHYPASILFLEDLTPDSFTRFKAVLLVDRRVPLEPELIEPLARARAAGVAIFHDDTCRAEFVEGSTPLGVKFDRVSGDGHAVTDDSAYPRLARYYEKHLATFTNALRQIGPPRVEVDNPQVHVSERVSGKARFVFVVNNTLPEVEPGHLWRMTMFAASRAPTVARVRLHDLGQSEVFDVFAQREVHPDANGFIEADLRSLPARLYAVLPPGSRPADFGVPTTPVHTLFGPHIREVALSADGSRALFNTMNWDHNLYAIDTQTGKTDWRQRAGHYFAFAPQAAGKGFAVQGFDFNSAEGYHLYHIDSAGTLRRRFALVGLPGRLTHWFVPGILNDRINNFAVFPDAKWWAAAGDLGIAVWSDRGALKWSRIWPERRRRALLAVNDESLVVGDGMTVMAFDPRSGKESWRRSLGPDGEVLDGVVCADGKMFALRTTMRGGRVFVFRGRELVATLPTAADEIAFAPDGSHLAVTTERKLMWFSVKEGLRWIFPGDDRLHHPAVSPDGNRVVVSSELGTVTVLSTGGDILHESDLGALATTAWLPGGDLLLGTWMGTVTRWDGSYRPRWQTQLQPVARDVAQHILREDGAPTSRVTDWVTASAKVAPITPNLCTATNAHMRIGWGENYAIQVLHNTSRLVDGDPAAPASPWVSWSDLGHKPWVGDGPLRIAVDAFRERWRLEGVTFHDDPAHPEDWVRDARVSWWDAEKARWVEAESLRADAATHTHWLKTPIESSRFRIDLPGKAGNLRLGELVFHGKGTGPAHPDIAAGRATAVLFDEQDFLQSVLAGYGSAWRFEVDQPFHGGRCLWLAADAAVAPPFVPGFGHTIPTWDFEIAENPGPGQYRWLQFAWRALAPETRSIGVQLGTGFPHEHDGIELHCGSPLPDPTGQRHQLADAPPKEWRMVRVDLWKLWQRPKRIRTLGLRVVGGPAAIDLVVLGRSPSDLPQLTLPK